MGNLTDLATMEALRNVINGETPVQKAKNADNIAAIIAGTQQVGSALNAESANTASAGTN